MTARLTMLLTLALPGALLADPPQTVAEKSEYKAASRHADVVAFCQQLAKESSLVRVGELGTSHEGRKLPLLILADPPIATAAEATSSGKLVVFAMGNIHAGEVDGMEALQMLARDLVTAKDRALLKQIVVVFCPIFNADGNEKVAKTNRPHQNGPSDGVGLRANAQGFDLNRDFVKLESPEVRSLVRFLNQWNPGVVIDCHTTNGSYHRYTLTYEGGRCPAGDARIIDFTRDELLAEVNRRMEKQTGYRSTFYGNFSPDRREWQSVLPTPRYGTHHVGLRNRIAVLSESYVYASYKDRVLVSRAFVKNILEYSAEHRDKISKLLTQAKTTYPDQVPIQYKPAVQGRPLQLLGFEEETKDGKRINTGKPKTYDVLYMGATTPTVSVKRPYAYLIPANFAKVGETLQRHGITVEQLREELELDVETYRVERITRQREFQKHQPVSLQVASRKESRRVPAGTLLVRTAQPLSALACFLLEPESLDSLTTWNFFDTALKEGDDFPVLRLPAAVPMLIANVRPLAEDRKRDRPILPNAPLPNFSGNPVSGLRWFPDGEHFLQTKDGKPQRVHALTGRCQPFFDIDKCARALSALPAFRPASAKRILSSPLLRLNADLSAALIEHEQDLYHVPLDGGKAVRLTRTPTAEELVTFSPDGKMVAFVRGNNLHAVDVASQSEHALTSDGGDMIRNGKASWVYFEELFNRNWQAYWWSPDSKHLAFLRFDETPVPRFHILDGVRAEQRMETTAYPKAGKPNPLVRLGMVAATGGPVRWVDLSNYTESASLIVRAGWTPDSQTLYLYVQDRAQTWLDVCTAPSGGGATRRLLRDTTKAWVEDPGPAMFLKDGSFLLASERSGWKHLYHFESDGKLRKQVTNGEWEARKLHTVDEADGWVYLSGTRDSHLGENLYRVRLDGTGLARLTSEAGSHSANVSPKAKYFVDSRSNHTSPTQVMLRKTDGAAARVLDTNPVYGREEYRTGKFEMVQIKTPDNVLLEGSLLYPPTFDPKRQYPVWFMTYAGPHAPTVRDAWAGGRVRDEMLAQMGFIVFRCDPRSASGKGACSTWTAYRQLGVQELKDIECAIDWVTKKPGVDAKRVGMSGGSYGGFMTAFALTHSKRFAAGVASAPVTDWRNYDSIYTERYMNTPQENPKGYDATSVVGAARNLHGKLLLVHGLMDDNVHAQNTIQLMDAFQRAGREFEVMLYPRSRHGIVSPHYQKLTLEFMRKALRPGE